jgi:50S ribosomal protein L16 3-hydroxylase
VDTPWQLNLDCEQFLARHWQKKPLLVRNAIEGFSAPLGADELAGLAMEDEVESRIIEYRDRAWHLHHGPFSEDDFHRSNPWTLLVQAVDQHVPEVGVLRRLFDFIPQWRFDDIMASYAVDGGGVGPHFDNYDVFLLQASGKREWRLGQYCSPDTPLLPHADLRILETFESSETGEHFVLEPGDMLYVPPRLAHWGIARGDCTTWSIGFRAPRIGDMVSRWVDRLLEDADPDEFFHDAGREPSVRPGEISSRDLERVAAQLQAALDQAEGDRWFGELVTEPRYEPSYDADEYAEARAELRRGKCTVHLDAASRVAWQHTEGVVSVFANGESRDFSEAVLPLLVEICGHGLLAPAVVAATVATPAAPGDERWALLDYLLERGCVYVD